MSIDKIRLRKETEDALTVRPLSYYRNVIELLDENERLRKALEELRHTCVENIGSWMSAAHEDPKVCVEMKHDIREFFKAIQRTNVG